MPTEAYSFEPVWVLFAVKNDGSAPVYMAGGGYAGYGGWPQGADVFYARAGETPHHPVGRPVAVRLSDHAEDTIWLAPGERWLFYIDVGSELGVLDGEMTVQAVMSGDGRCGKRQVGGRHTYPLAPLQIETHRVGTSRFDVYRCWKGEVRSSARSVRIKRPFSREDQEASGFLLQRRGVGLLHDRESGTWRLRWAPFLYERFPTSHYTYALLARSGGTGAMELQPENPLNPWLRGLLARQALDVRSRCSKQKDPWPNLDIAKLDLPAGVREYLDQYAWYLEHLHCRGFNETGAGGAAGRRRQPSRPASYKLIEPTVDRLLLSPAAAGAVGAVGFGARPIKRARCCTRAADGGDLPRPPRGGALPRLVRGRHRP